MRCDRKAPDPWHQQKLRFFWWIEEDMAHLGDGFGGRGLLSEAHHAKSGSPVGSVHHVALQDVSPLCKGVAQAAIVQHIRAAAGQATHKDAAFGCGCPPGL